MIPAFDGARRMPAEVDLTLLWSGLVLLLIGMVMVYSASIAIAEASRYTSNHPTYFLVRHAVFLAIGLVAAGCAFQVPLATWTVPAAPAQFCAGATLFVAPVRPDADFSGDILGICRLGANTQHRIACSTDAARSWSMDTGLTIHETADAFAQSVQSTAGGHTGTFSPILFQQEFPQHDKATAPRHAGQHCVDCR